MENWKIKVLEFVSKLFDLEIQIKPKLIKNFDLCNMLVTDDVVGSIYDVLEYFKEKKETELQREIGILCKNLELSFNIKNDYYQYRKNVFKSDNKKLKMIEILKGIEHGKADIIYEDYWHHLIYMLIDCKIIDKQTAKKIHNNIHNVFKECEVEE